MTARRGRILGRAALGVAGWAAGVAWAIEGSTVLSVLMSITGGVWLALAITEWRKPNGSNREAEAGPQHPDPGTITVNFAVGGPVPTLHFTGGTDTPPRQDLDLEVVESEVPILAQRVARLLFAGTSRHWGSLHKSESFGVDADARCSGSLWSFRSSQFRHQAPAVECECGFYAVPCDIEPWTEGAPLVTLLVELSGTVVEHERGYRASHQRVVECRIPPCRFCGSVAEFVDVRDGAMAAACCSAHLPHADDQVLVSTEDVAKLLPVPVTLDGRPKAESEAAS